MPTKRVYQDHNGVIVEADEEPEFLGNRYYVDKPTGANVLLLDFQNGSPITNGINGVTNEQMLAILIHRVRHLDSKFASDDNKEAIEHMLNALTVLERRTNERIRRGVEGKLES